MIWFIWINLFLIILKGGSNYCGVANWAYSTSINILKWLFYCLDFKQIKTNFLAKYKNKNNLTWKILSWQKWF